jgi:hypothetical protein
VKRQLSARTWSKPLSAAATRPRHFFWMDWRIFGVAAFCVAVAMWAPDVRAQLVFAVLAFVVGAGGVFAWRRNPYLIDALQAHFSVPNGGPAHSSEVS